MTASEDIQDKLFNLNKKKNANGWPDRAIEIDGKLAGWEYKNGNEPLRPEQRLRLQQLVRSGIRVFVTRIYEVTSDGDLSAIRNNAHSKAPKQSADDDDVLGTIEKYYELTGKKTDAVRFPELYETYFSHTQSPPVSQTAFGRILGRTLGLTKGEDGYGNRVWRGLKRRQ